MNLLLVDEDPDPYDFTPYIDDIQESPRQGQVPHLLVIEDINFDRAGTSEFYLECPVDPYTGMAFCSMIGIGPRMRLKLPGCQVGVNFRTSVHCWIAEDVLETGLVEMLGGYEHGPWPDHLPQAPGTYLVRWQSEGAFDDFHSWLELI